MLNVVPQSKVQRVKEVIIRQKTTKLTCQRQSHNVVHSSKEVKRCPNQQHYKVVGHSILSFVKKTPSQHLVEVCVHLYLFIYF